MFTWDDGFNYYLQGRRQRDRIRQAFRETDSQSVYDLPIPGLERPTRAALNQQPPEPKPARFFRDD